MHLTLQDFLKRAGGLRNCPFLLKGFGWVMQGRVHEVQDFNGQIDLYCRGTSQRLFDDKDGPWQEMARDKCFTFRKRRAQSREWRGIVLLRFFNDNGTPVRIRIFPSMNDAA